MKRLFLTLAILGLSVIARAQQKSNLTASSTNCVTANSCLSVAVDPNQGGATFTLTGTFSATVQFEGSGDGGTTWVALNVMPSASSTSVSSATAAGVWQANISGYTNVRERVSTFSSGTVVASLITSTASARSAAGGSGFATIGGTIANTQVAFGSAANTISGSPNLTYASGTNILTDGSTTIAASIFDLPLGTGTSANCPAASASHVYLCNEATDTSLLFSNDGVAYQPVGNVSTAGLTLSPSDGVVLASTALSVQSSAAFTSNNTGTVNIGAVGAGFQSIINFNGITSGTAGIGAAAVAGTPNKINLPTATGGANALLATDGGNPQQSSWTLTPSLTSVTAATYSTATNCASAGGTCGSAAAGAVTVAAAATTVTVATTAVTANSEILLQYDSSLGTRLSVTCNTTASPLAVTARTAATSFVVTVPAAPVTNPLCLNFHIVN